MVTAVISAFPACGKTYAFNHFKDKYSMLDSDSSEFSWIKDANSKNTKVRNPDFPANYIQHIKENIGKVDIIFVSSHLQVREALTEAGINYCTVYPKDGLKDEWISRMKARGDTNKAIQFISYNFESFVSSVLDEPHGFVLVKLGAKEHISPDHLYKMFALKEGGELK